MDDKFDVTLSVGEYLALRDSRLVYAYATAGRWGELADLFRGDPVHGDGGYSAGQLRLLDGAVDRMEPLAEATPFSVETRAWLERMRRSDH